LKDDEESQEGLVKKSPHPEMLRLSRRERLQHDIFRHALYALLYGESKRGVSPSSYKNSPFPFLREGGQGDGLLDDFNQSSAFLVSLATFALSHCFNRSLNNQ
jgi:hypothetical protein